MDDQGYQAGETVPFVREADALRFVSEELSKGRSVTIWPVADQAYVLAAISNETGK